MLGTRTKQVFSYGRRGHRIVNIYDRKGKDLSVDEVFEDSFSVSPRHMGPSQKGAILIPPSPPNCLERKLSHSMLHGNDTTPRRKKSQGTRRKKDTSGRQPMTPIRLNVVSPRHIPAKKAKRMSARTGARVSLKPCSPIVAVDIIIIDGDGRKISQERRFSHADVQVNHANSTLRRNFSNTSDDKNYIVISDDSDTEESPPPRLHRTRRKLNPPLVISSDGSDTEAMSGSIPPLPPSPSFTRTYEDPPLDHIPHTLHETSRPIMAPPVRPRQLTPIRHNSHRAIFQRSFPTPSTPTDADLSLELAQLNLSDGIGGDDWTLTHPSYLLPLLRECEQTCPYEFSAFIETFPFDPVVQLASDEDIKFQKIGEASFSEVFGIGDVVLKVIPVQNEEELPYQGDIVMPAPSTAKDILREIIVTREIGEMCQGFVKLLKTYVVRGKYPTLFLKLWDEYCEKKGSESVRPDSFGLHQAYAIIVLPNGGPDLESFVFKNPSKLGWQQACSIFWQVARALEQAEDLVRFEHRDLHWGQILVKSVPIKRFRIDISLDDVRLGVKTTIIDLGLSRMDAIDSEGQKTYWSPFDEDIFDGEGDYQYDVYRMMRNLNRNDWNQYQPFTNVIWLHYLTSKLLYSKRLKPPRMRKKAACGVQPGPVVGFDEKECYSCLVEMEKMLGDCIGSRLKPIVQKGCRKLVALPGGLESVKDVVAHGVRRGWIQA